MGESGKNEAVFIEKVKMVKIIIYLMQIINGDVNVIIPQFTDKKIKI